MKKKIMVYTCHKKYATWPICVLLDIVLLLSIVTIVTINNEYLNIPYIKYMYDIFV